MSSPTVSRTMQATSIVVTIQIISLDVSLHLLCLLSQPSHHQLSHLTTLRYSELVFSHLHSQTVRSMGILSQRILLTQTVSVVSSRAMSRLSSRINSYLVQTRHSQTGTLTELSSKVHPRYLIPIDTTTIPTHHPQTILSASLLHQRGQVLKVLLSTEGISRSMKT